MHEPSWENESEVISSCLEILFIFNIFQSLNFSIIYLTAFWKVTVMFDNKNKMICVAAWIISEEEKGRISDQTFECFSCRFSSRYLTHKNFFPCVVTRELILVSGVICTSKIDVLARIQRQYGKIMSFFFLNMIFNALTIFCDLQSK